MVTHSCSPVDPTSGPCLKVWREVVYKDRRKLANSPESVAHFFLYESPGLRLQWTLVIRGMGSMGGRRESTQSREWIPIKSGLKTLTE